MCIADVALIILVSAGFWRWGIMAIGAMITLLNITTIAILVSYGADPLAAALTGVGVAVVAGVALLPIAAGLAWIGWTFWRKVGGLHAK